VKRMITLKYPAKCAECGTDLHPGDKARFYGMGKVYGTTCHARTDPAARPRQSKFETIHGTEV